MAATTQIANRIERSLHAVMCDIHDLPDWTDEWEGMNDGERASLSLEWDHMMDDYLTELDEYYRAGMMSSEQQTRYQALLRTLRGSFPILRRLNLRLPPVSLEDYERTDG